MSNAFKMGLWQSGSAFSILNVDTWFIAVEYLAAHTKPPLISPCVSYALKTFTAVAFLVAAGETLMLRLLDILKTFTAAAFLVVAGDILMLRRLDILKTFTAVTFLMAADIIL